MRRKDPLLTFWSKVTKTDNCWNWTASCNPVYGQSSFFGKPKSAHRVSWFIHYGEIPNGLFVCHKCDNPKCVRPDHLFLGTNSDNVRDAFRKGRASRKGDKANHKKLNQLIVNEIRRTYTGEYGEMTMIAKKYGVKPGTIEAVINNITWKQELIAHASQTGGK